MKQRALLFALVLALSGGAQAQSNEELKSMLDQALKTIQDLQNRVKALEGQKQPAPAPPAPTAAKTPPPEQPTPPAVTAAGAPVVAPNAKADEGAPNADKARLEIFGKAQLDAIYDFKRVDPSWNATLRPSKIPVNCPGDAGCGKDGETIFSIRQSSLGFRAFIPTKWGELTTLFDMDLFDAGGTGSGTHARVLDAWGELGWFGAGQYYTVFMDVDTFPNTIDYWGPSGMIFIRNPQLRITPLNRDGMKLAFSLESPNAAIDTGKVNEIDPALGANITGRTRYPDFAASFRVDREWGHVQAAGLLRQVGFQTLNTAGNEPSGTKTGYGLNLSGQLNTWGKDRVVGQLAAGRAIASYMNDGGSDLAPGANLQAETVKSIGWFAYYDHYWSEQWSSSLGYSEHRQSNTEGQLSNAFHKGSYSSVNLLYTPLKNLTTGAELLWGQLENKDGSSAEDHRIQFSTKYTF